MPYEDELVWSTLAKAHVESCYCSYGTGPGTGLDTAPDTAPGIVGTPKDYGVENVGSGADVDEGIL